MSNLDELTISSKQRLACNLSAGACVILSGLVLLLAGLNVISADVKLLIVPVLLTAVGVSLLITALIQKNSVSLWISFAFTVPALVSYLAAFTRLTYAQLYPLYIAIPAIASLFTMIMSREFAAHLKSAAFFGIIAGLFALKSSGLVGWGVTLPLLVVFIGLLIVYFAIAFKRNEAEENTSDA